MPLAFFAFSVSTQLPSKIRPKKKEAGFSAGLLTSYFVTSALISLCHQQ
jgi:hypothetical protein